MPPDLTRTVQSQPGSEPRLDERRLRELFDRTFQFIGLLSPDGTLLEINRTALDLIGASREDVVGLPFWDTPFWRTAEDRDRLRAGVAAAAAGEFVRYETEHEAAGGGTIVVDLSLKPVRGEDGRVELIIPEGRDITDAKRAEEALRISEAKFSGIVSISSDAILSIDVSQTIIHFNRGAEEIFGYREDEILGQPLEILIPEAFRRAHRHHVEAFGASPVAARRMGERSEIAGLRKNGEEFPAEASISKLDLGGSRIYTVVLRDITQRKRVERAQRFLAEAGAVLASSLDFDTTLESIVRLAVPTLADWCVIYAAEPDDRIRRLHSAHADGEKEHLLERLATYPIEASRPHPVIEVLRTGTASLENDVAEARVDAFASDAEHGRIQRALGMRSWLVVPLTARGEAHGAIGFYRAAARRGFEPDEVALAHDLAGRAALAMDNARLYGEARRAIEARDDLLAVVSHDLGNPLSAIRIGTSLLLKHLPREELGTAGWQHLDGIRQSVEQMERLIENLLQVKRLEAGLLTLNRRSHRVASLVRAAVEALAPVARARSLTLDCHLSDDLPNVLADSDRIHQVFSNLIGNSIKFTPEGGAITVEAAREGAEVRFCVADTGIGIPPGALPRIFDRFWQARETRPKGKGIGLGLSIVKGIVDAHDGRIWVESREGVGTTFHFTLPIA